MLSRRYLFAACVTVTLAACGGSDSPSPAPAPTPAPTPTPAPAPAVAAPSGLHVGTTSTNYELNVLMLEDGSLWGLYERTVNNIGLVYGVVQANGAATNGSYAATDGRDYYYTGATTAGVVSASYTAAGTFNGSVSSATGAVSFTTSKPATSPYNYDTPAQLSAMVGTWSGTTLDGATTNIVISSTGAVAGASGACNFTGTVVPRPSGKNVFNVGVTFANSSACLLPGGSASGIAITYPISGTTRNQVVVAIQNTARTFGTGFLAIR